MSHLISHLLYWLLHPELFFTRESFHRLSGILLKELAMESTIYSCTFSRKFIVIGPFLIQKTVNITSFTNYCARNFSLSECQRVSISWNVFSTQARSEKPMFRSFVNIFSITFFSITFFPCTHHKFFSKFHTFKNLKPSWLGPQNTSTASLLKNCHRKDTKNTSDSKASVLKSR